jgi:SM-20-related protein
LRKGGYNRPPFATSGDTGLGFAVEEFCWDDPLYLDGLYGRIADALAGPGYCVLPNALPDHLVSGLAARIMSLSEEDFRRAGIGREEDRHINDFVRTDEVRWLSRSDPAEIAYLEWMEGLRLGINRRLFLGLFDYECHFAHYAPGAYYKRHLDAFNGNTNRVVTTVSYLNSGWRVEDGGHLLIYPPEGEADSLAPIHTVSPLAGTLVVFLSERFPHEVSVARRGRYSIAGWFRVNGSHAARVDPPA